MKNSLYRNILCINDINTLSDSDYFLYAPYKNIVKNFYSLSCFKTEGQFDYIYKEFNGINNAEDRNYYESFLGITSYFQASKGGRGKYIEKKLCAVSENCCINVRISDLAKLFLFKEIVRNYKLFGKESLNAEEKKTLRLCEWSFINNNDETTDLCCIQGKTISFLELKNRVDSGGVSARREIFDNKFKQILDFLISDDCTYQYKNKKYTLLNFYKHFGIDRIQLSLGILFSTNGEYATIEHDKYNGFYSSSKECFERLSNYLKNNTQVSVVHENLSTLSLKLKLKDSFIVEITSVYGQGIPYYLYQKDINVDSLIKNKYDDIWLFQLLSIEERANLLRYNNNAILEVKKYIRSNYQLKKLIDNFINTNNSEQIIKFFQNFSIEEKLIPNDREKTKYLLDVLYFIIANEDDL